MRRRRRARSALSQVTLTLRHHQGSQQSQSQGSQEASQRSSPTFHLSLSRKGVLLAVLGGFGLMHGLRDVLAELQQQQQW